MRNISAKEYSNFVTGAGGVWKILVFFSLNDLFLSDVYALGGMNT